jgi:hypothetical protein
MVQGIVAKFHGQNRYVGVEVPHGHLPPSQQGCPRPRTPDGSPKVVSPDQHTLE